MQEIVAVNGVSMKYQSPNGETEALRNISFSVGDGEYASIVGPSGCGKSTILSIIAGLISDYSGEVRVYGRTMEGASPHLGYMLQRIISSIGAPSTKTPCWDWKSAASKPGKIWTMLNIF